MPLSIKEYLARGPATSKEIQAGTGLSQSSVARQLRSLGDDIIRLQDGRSLRYAVTRNAFGANDKLPLSMVDAYGNTVLAAYIRPLVNGGFFLEAATGMPPLLLGENKNGLYDDLPYFLFDLKPQGFMGRQIAEEMASQSDDFPSDPRRWNTNHIGRYL
ncbi:MAG: ArsR family transcriptional regulator, partial [Desulfosalsimonadaceae bacterium]|nr:ArsR family transcriptional regulator [Desulfosalsimonadaceae bacterium]